MRHNLLPGWDADFRNWPDRPDAPLVLDVIDRDGDNRPTRVVALRVLEGEEPEFTDADAVVDWTVDGPTVRWARPNGQREVAWQIERFVRGRAAADAAHPTT